MSKLFKEMTFQELLARMEWAENMIEHMQVVYQGKAELAQNSGEEAEVLPSIGMATAFGFSLEYLRTGEEGFRERIIRKSLELRELP